MPAGGRGCVKSLPRASLKSEGGAWRGHLGEKGIFNGGPLAKSGG